MQSASGKKLAEAVATAEPWTGLQGGPETLIRVPCSRDDNVSPSTAPLAKNTPGSRKGRPPSSCSGLVVSHLVLTKSKTEPGEIKGEVFKKAAPESQNRANKGGNKRSLETKGNKLIADVFYHANMHQFENVERIYMFPFGEPTHQYAFIFVGANENKKQFPSS